MTAVLGTTAGAVSNETMNWHDIEWDKVHRIVRRLQARIVKATHFCWETASCSARRLRCLSRVKGDFHARFLGGWGPAMAPGYPTSRDFDCSTRIVVNSVAKVLTPQPPSG